MGVARSQRSSRKIVGARLRANKKYPLTGYFIGSRAIGPRMPNRPQAGSNKDPRAVTSARGKFAPVWISCLPALRLL